MTSTKVKDDLAQKIKGKTIRAGVIGLGYVGLPLCVEFSKVGIAVTGLDIDAKKTESINKGISYIGDVASDEVKTLVKNKKLTATTDFSAIRELDTINICVPTPLRKTKDPDISYIVAATKEIAKYLHPGMLIVLESTTYPGTTEEIILPMLEETGLKVGKDFYLAFSPERVDPGNPKFNTKNITKVVGGVTPECTDLAVSFYSLAIDTVHPVSSTRSAEMVKLLENTFRSVNIGLVNELCQMSEKLNANIWEIIDAAATKPFGFMPFYPGPGLGGHCIPIDPHYLAWKARSSGFNPRFIELASDVNEGMPEFVVRKAQAILNDQQKSVKGASVHILGVTYKKNVSDFRESPAMVIMQMFAKQGAAVTMTDPYVPCIEIEGAQYASQEITSLKKSPDLVILLTDHDAFDHNTILSNSSIILDTRNAFKGNPSSKVVRI